jgi:hypothetical protein
MQGVRGVIVQTIIVFLILLLSIVFLLPVASAETITVGTDRQYSDIQLAIDAASPGDTIEVYPLTDDYYEAGQPGILIDVPVT